MASGSRLIKALADFSQSLLDAGDFHDFTVEVSPQLFSMFYSESRHFLLTRDEGQPLSMLFNHHGRTICIKRKATS